VPGHELSGVIVALGREVKNWAVGDRVTVPFVGGCGTCPECDSGNQQVCDNQFQPGFTHWGSFADYVEVHQADINLVRLPDHMSFATAASLGCRFATSFRAVVDQGQVGPGQWVAIHGCGGIGLSAIMIARALGARPIAIDITEPALNMARSVGAEQTVDASRVDDVADAVKSLTGRGADVSIDALGIKSTCINSITCLKKRGRHVQVGWMLGAHSSPPVPMDLVMGNELEIVGSHGMQAHRYNAMLDMISRGALAPDRLIQETLSLEASIGVLTNFDRRSQLGISVITEFN
jgi:alcohol dehydrogenase